jgi:hypothetical protein
MRITGVVVQGTGSFRRDVYSALLLLRRSAPVEYEFVTNRVCYVGQNDYAPSGANVWVCPALIQMTTEAASNTEWCASALVHEASHIEQARRSHRRHNGMLLFSEITGTNIEMEANAAQAKVLYKLQAPYLAIASVEQDKGRHWLENVHTWTNLSASNFFVLPIPLREANPNLWRDLQRALGRRANTFECGQTK